MTYYSRLAEKLCLLAAVSLLVTFNAGADASKQLKIGFVLPMTGEIAFTGKDIQRGAELAQAELKEIDTALLIEDTAFDLARTATATRKLIEQDNADVIVSLWDEADVVAPISEQARKLHIAIRWDPEVTKDRPLTFTLESTYQSYARAAVALFKSAKVKSISILSQEIKSGDLVISEMERQFLQSDIEVFAREIFSSGTTDFRSMLLRAGAKKPDLLFVFAFPPYVETAIRQLRQVRPGQRFTGMFELIENLSLIEGIPCVAPFGSSPEFDEKFKARFGESYRVRAPHSYELVKLLADTYKDLWASAKPTPEAVSRKLLTVKNRQSSLGPLTVSSSRNIEHPPQFNVVINGKRKFISEEMLSSIKW